MDSATIRQRQEDFYQELPHGDESESLAEEALMFVELRSLLKRAAHLQSELMKRAGCDKPAGTHVR